MEPYCKVLPNIKPQETAKTKDTQWGTDYFCLQITINKYIDT